MATLPTLQPGTLISASSTEATLVGTEPVLEELGSANDSTYLRQTTDNTTLTVDAWFELENMPTNFGSMDTLAIQLRYNNSATLALNYWGDITAQVFQSDGTTALCNEVQVVGFPNTNGNGDASIDTAGTPTNSSSVSLNTGLNTTANSTVWDGARLRITYDITKQKGGDVGVTYEITAGELTGTYTAVTVWTGVLTSQLATSAQGTLTTKVDDSITLTGEEATSAQGTLTTVVGDSITLTGLEATSAEGTLTTFIAQIAPLTGEEATSEFGTLTTTTDDIGLLTGQEVTASEGTITVLIDDTGALAGQEATAGFGTLTPFVYNSGQLTSTELTAAEGTLSITIAREVPGEEATSAIGTLGIQVNDVVTLSGEEATSAIGTLVPENIRPITGQEVTSANGTITIKADESILLTGQEATVSPGILSLKINESIILNGLEATAEQGTPAILADALAIVTGVSAVTLQGTVNGVIVPRLTEVIQSLNPGAILEFIEVDLTSLGDTVYYFHNGTNELNTDVVWQGITYNAFPIFTEGFEQTSQGQIPRPVLRVANISGLISVLLNDFGNMIGAKVTRRRTFAKFIDKVNFASGSNPTADPNVHFPNDVYYIDRKSNENMIFVEFELASMLDLTNIRLPRRQIVQNTCQWLYRGQECNYTGGPVADEFDNPTSDPQVDKCGKRISSCKLRFGTGELPYGGFPGSGLISS